MSGEVQRLALGLLDVLVPAVCDSTESTDRPMSLVLRLSNSGLALEKAPSSVVHTGVKSFGWENRIPQESPEPLVEIDRALGRLGGEVGGGVAQTDCQCSSSCVDRPWPSLGVALTAAGRGISFSAAATLAKFLGKVDRAGHLL